jgi:hypothetical protein
MVNLATLGLILSFAVPGQTNQVSFDQKDASKAVKSALSKAKFSWYDDKTDAARPINLSKDSDDSSQNSSWNPGSSKSTSTRFSWPGLSGIGNAITMLGFGIVLAILIGLLIWFWRIYEPVDVDEAPKEPKKRGEASRVESLPEGMENEFDTNDPWGEAIRRRNRGDLAGAIICLFAHQLLTLSKLGLVRLAPGRTGRQLVRAVTDGELRALVQPTLRLFEVVYYGHRQPTEKEFEAVWTGAESFEKRVAVGVFR